MTVRAIIAEDEPLLAASLQAALAEAWPELEIAGVAANGADAIALAERERPQVAFLDIRMPGMSGLEAAEALAECLGEAVPAIVFVTAYDEYALKAFDAAAVDYVLKPVSAAALARAVQRLKARIATRGDELSMLAAQLRSLMAAPQSSLPAGEALRTIRAAAGSTVKMIPVELVLYFQATDKYTSVVTAEGTALLRTPLKELLAQLPPGRFRQVHRGTIVNLDAIATAHRDASGRLSLRLKESGEMLAVSRVYADLFKAM